MDERPAPARQPALHDERVPCGEEHLGDRRRVARSRTDAGSAAPGGRGWRPARRSSRRLSMPITRSPISQSVTRVADRGDGAGVLHAGDLDVAPARVGVHPHALQRCRRGCSAVCVDGDEDLVGAGHRVGDVLDASGPRGLRRTGRTTARMPSNGYGGRVRQPLARRRRARRRRRVCASRPRRRTARPDGRTNTRSR